MQIWDKYYCPYCHAQPLRLSRFNFDQDENEYYLGICGECGRVLQIGDLDEQDADEDECD